jgi:hypothetical protein
VDQNTESSSQQNIEPSVSAPSTEVSSEKMIPQSQVDSLVGRVRKETRERMESEFQQRKPAEIQQPNPQQSSASIGNEDVRKIIGEEMQKQRDEIFKQSQIAEANKIAHEFMSKIDAGKSEYSDFDETLSNIPLEKIPHIVQLAAGVDNTAGVMYELAQNPTKISSIYSLLAIDFEAQKSGINSNLARKEIQKLSESIRLNKEAKQAKTSNAPLSQLKSSLVGLDNGSDDSKTVSDFRKVFRTRR